MNERIESSDKIIRNHIIWSMGAGLIPVPIADFFAVSAIQLDMVRQMCKLYDLDFKETEGKAVISSMTSSGLARLGAQAAIKIIPGIGTVVGGMTMAVLSGASTYALGEVFKKHFETGGTFLDFDIDRLTKMYKEKFEKGKKVAEEIKKEQEEKQEVIEKVENSKIHIKEQKDVISHLTELGKLKDKGILSDEEFKAMKKKLIEEF
ncbi:MAG: DUF697 domain-containing protein [Saprospiraceae bacterium]|nr:DUF697 domain-containing protein [bacterium]MDC3219544.1 DUF697 domain-containing protein [Saprospiraceae bacterium]MDG1434168.1 DUF697 domain-containing protein [Saprospiraceae bacterium]MDG2419158.1 DUF697 domain-containing protein [Saprospiraceae bacterium]